MKKQINIIGRVEKIDLPEQKLKDVPARIDTGARISSIWASNIQVNEDGSLSFYLFDTPSPFFSGHLITVPSYSQVAISSSMGMVQKRYKVKLPIRIKDRKIRVSFTLADRSKQVYPVLIGRNTLRGKFIVDVQKGAPLQEAEKEKLHNLRKLID